MTTICVDGFDQGIIFRWRLGRDAEVVWGEAAEIGGIADEHTMFLYEIFLQCDGMHVLYFAEHEIGHRRKHADTGNLAKVPI